MRTTRQWTWFLGTVIVLVLIVVHLIILHRTNYMLAAMEREKAGIYLDALGASATQTLQASHFLEERIVSRLKTIAEIIKSTPPDSRVNKFLVDLASQNELRKIEICDGNGMQARTAAGAVLTLTRP